MAAAVADDESMMVVVVGRGRWEPGAEVWGCQTLPVLPVG